MSKYAMPQTLVETGWVADHLDSPNVRLAEIDVDTFSYEEGHVPGAVGWDWAKELCNQHTRDILSKEAFEALMQRSGISRETTVVLYGDNNNWFAAWAFWQMKIYGHDDVRLMNGGRRKWLAEGRALTSDTPTPTPATYEASPPDLSIRSYLATLREEVAAKKIALVDVRSPAEFSGELLSPPGLPETCQRGGHVPGASCVPWGLVCNEDGTFKSFDQLREIYGSRGITGDKPIVAYCRIGERSSHSWYVLKYLLGYSDVRNYDGSWTEWGNLVGAPIEK